MQLLTKLSDNDPDFRFMALNDLITVFANGKPDMLYHDYNTAARTIDHVVKALDDQNGEVQNQAIKWSVSFLPLFCFVDRKLTLLPSLQPWSSGRQDSQQPDRAPH